MFVDKSIIHSDYISNNVLVTQDETHRSSRNVPVLCDIAVQFLGAAGQEPSVHTPPELKGRHWAWKQSREEMQKIQIKGNKKEAKAKISP